MIELIDLYVSYGWRREPIIKGVSAKFDGFHLVLGPNGSGKTTLFRAIAGLTPITSGKILIDGVDVNAIYGKPGVLSINLGELYSLMHLSTFDHLRLFMDLAEGDMDLALKILGDLGVDIDLLKRRKPWELSAGQKKAYSTAIALASRAKHVLLDEPFEQLDPARKSRLLEYFREFKGVILINTHETWLLPVLRDWSTVFVFEGKLYGPIAASELLEAKLAVGEVEDALLKFEVAGKTYSVVVGDIGEPLSRLTTLDKVYELAVSG